MENGMLFLTGNKLYRTVFQMVVKILLGFKWVHWSELVSSVLSTIACTTPLCSNCALCNIFFLNSFSGEDWARALQDGAGQSSSDLQFNQRSCHGGAATATYQTGHFQHKPATCPQG
jgi:hypothetical protein